MKYRPFLFAIVLNSFLFLGCFSESKEKELPKPKPNILLIMADDLGYGDLGCYGGEIATPNLDRLAKQGLRLTECYNNGICAPSRASLLTGRYPHETGIGFFNIDLQEKGYEGFLNKESLTFGEVFQEGGYETYMSGKWHIGNDSLHQPQQRGFDRFFGILDGGASYFDDEPIMKVIQDRFYLDGNQKYNIKEKDFYATDVFTDKGIQFLKEQETSKPFFLYMAYNAPHWPLHAKEQDIAKYKNRYDIGWDSLRTLRHQKQMALGIVKKGQSAAVETNVPKWNSLTKEEQETWSEKMEVYAAMVDNLDQNIGKLLAYLKETNQLEETLILFVSDNGADEWDIQKIPLFIPSKGKVGHPGSNESYGEPWAHLSNVPFRNYNARYPKEIPADIIEKGGIHFVDFLPTLLAFAEIDYPKIYQNINTKPLAGENFLPLLKGKEWRHQKPICYEWAGNRAIRKGNWKMLSTYPANQWQLYDMQTDRIEAIDLAKEKPDLVKALNLDYQKWADKTGVVTWNEEMLKRTGFN